MDEQSCSTSTGQVASSSTFHQLCVPNDFQTCIPISSKPHPYNETIPKPVHKTRFEFRVELDKRCYQHIHRRHTSAYDIQVLKKRRFRNAVSLNNIEGARILLDLGISANSSDSQRRSPLHLAASKGYTDMVRLLLQHGADPNWKDNLGNTPLHLAACTNNIEIVTLLLDAGTDVASLDKCGRNPLQLAQSKLRLIKEIQKTRIDPPEMEKLKDQIQQVVAMMLSYLQKQTSARVELDDLSDKLNKLKTSDISDIDGEVSKLLDDLQILEINKK